MFWGDLTPKTLYNIILTFKRHLLTPNHVIRAINHQNRSSRLGCARANGNKNGKKTVNFLLYVAYLCRPPLHAINTILVRFHDIPDVINHANFGVDRVIGV